ncbi:MOSC domain-containing protein [Zavarzinia sp.]|uniref:MOSC domain-containing protein n=1 Tax=Zavarzinia sp. TaxID=2027920 RepID=UPI00356ADF3A
MNAPVAVDALFAGQVARLAGDSRSSAIVKTPVSGRRLLTAEGLAGDAQADRRVHGGVGKALHHYPAEHYARLAAAFAEARHLAPGGLGENISTRGMTEDDVCIGDIFRLGEARIQVSQPRTPCWKIDTRTACEGVAAFIAEHGLAGWYYRVLDAGEIAAGDRLEHIERPADAVTLAEFSRLVRQTRPSIAAVLRLAHANGLDPNWTAKLMQRAEWLRNNGGSE